MSGYKSIVLIFSLIRTASCFFCFTLSKIVDNEYSLAKTKKICKHAYNKLPFAIIYVSYKYKTQEMCHKVVLENSLTATKTK